MDKQNIEGEDITRPEVTENYVRVPVSQKQKGDKIRTITISSRDGIKALYAINRKVIVTYLFQKSKGWTMAKAKAWVKEHKKSEKSLTEKSMKNVSRFSFEIPVLKARATVVKDEDGNEVEERFIEGVASSTDIDLHGDRMAPSAIQTMADSIKQHVITLNAEHDKSWQSELGEVSKFDVTEDYKLVMEAKLDKTSKSEDLWYALTEKKKKLGLSIGGFVRDFKIEVDEESGEWMRTFTNIELDHVAVVSSPANPKTWVSAISKSLDSITLKKKEESEQESLINLKEDTMDKKLPLETEVAKEEESKDESTEAETVTPETGEETATEAGTEEVAEATEEEKVEEAATEEATDSEAEEGTADQEAAEEEKEAEPVKEAEVTEEEASPEVTEEAPEEAEKSLEGRILEKAMGEINKLLKNEEISKTLSTLTDSVKEVLKSNEVLVKQNIELVKRVDALENQPAGRKVAVDKALGSDSTSTTPEKTLSEALKEADEKFKGKPNLFAIKQKIRQTYASMGIFE